MESQERSDWTEFIALISWPFVRVFGPSILQTGPALFVTSILLIFGGLLASRSWGPATKSQPQFQLNPDSILLPTSPEWIITDIRSEVLNDSLLQKATLLDDDLTLRLARALSAHPWVAKVRRVSKSPPNTVHVDLDYRTPVAMVEMAGDVYAVDASGILLPSDYFLANPEQVRKYPRVFVDRISLSVPVGSAWGDHRVVAASHVAALLATRWEQFGLYRIGLLSPTSPHDNSSPTFVLINRRGGRVIWGHEPRRETSGELTAQEKLRRLESFVERRGSLGDISESTVIDLNDATSLRLQPVSWPETK